jgi:hypothetical protein
MTAMRKEDVIRLFIDPSPGNFLPLFLKLSDPFFLRGLSHGFFMAFEAGGQVRDSRKGLGFEEAVTGITLRPLFRVLSMIEGDGLLGLGAKTEADEEEEQENPNSQSKEEKFHALNPLVNMNPPREPPRFL